MPEYNMDSLFIAAVKSFQGSHVSGAILVTLSWRSGFPKLWY